MPTLYDAARCPYCARVRIVLAEKGVPVETVPVGLDERPAFIRELNPPDGRVPVLEQGLLVVPESSVIMEYLEELHPEPALMPPDPGSRALVRLAIERFSERLGDPYYDLYRGRADGSAERLAGALAALDERLAASPFVAGDSYTLADIAYVPWVLRAEALLGADLEEYRALSDWLAGLLERPAIAAERDVVATLSP
ncbi:MAG: glutathione S-transferase family protein [Thermoleophilia bacterium]|nr:glutathione S-transferase family protein [Thermoleophilia bacterium]